MQGGFDYSAGCSAAWEKYYEETLTADTATIDIPNLPPSKMWRLHFYAKTTGAAAAIALRFNGDSGNNYDYQNINALGAVITASSATVGYALFFNPSNVEFTGGSCLILCPNDSERKLVMCERCSDALGLRVANTFWNSAAAINQITLTQLVAGRDYVAGSYILLERLR